MNTKKEAIKRLYIYLWTIVFLSVSVYVLLNWIVENQIFKILLIIVTFTVFIILWIWAIKLTFSLVYWYIYKILYPETIKRAENDKLIWWWKSFFEFIMSTNPDISISILKWLNRNK